MRQQALLWAAVMMGCTSATDDSDSSGEGDTAVTQACNQLSIVGELGIPEGLAAPTAPVSVDVIAVQMTEAGISDLGVRNIDRLDAEGGAFSLCIQTVPVEADLYAPDVDNGNFRAATYVLRAFVDDGHGDAERWIGASLPQVLLYATGEPPTDWASIGVVQGWNVLTMDLADGLANSAAPFESGGAIDVQADLLIRPQLPLTGTVEPNLGTIPSLAVGAYHISNWVDATSAPPAVGTLDGFPLSLQTANAAFAFPGAFGTPPLDHLSELDALPHVHAAFYMVVAWQDHNGNTTFELGEPIAADSTSAALPRVLAYVEPTDWRAAVYAPLGMRMGWNLSQDDLFLDWSQGVVLAEATP